VFRDQQETISENSSWDEDKLAGFVQSSISSTTQKPYNHSWDSNMTLANVEPARSVFSWYVFGAICALVVSIVFVVIAIRFRRRAGSECSVPATHCCDSNTRTYDKVCEDCQHIHYITIDRLHKVTGPKTELHYLCRDVTNLTDAAPEVSAHRRTASSKCICSGFLETNVDTLSTTEVFEGHVYEVVE
jgi:hypothetical protein